MSIVLDAISQHARSRADRPALSDERSSLAYGELDRHIDVTADLLAHHCHGDRPVATLLDNSLAGALVDLALLRLGRRAVPLPCFLAPSQVEHALASAGAQVLIRARAANGEGTPIEIAGRRLQVYRHETAAVPLPEGTSRITFTSGTTGAPRGVCLAQGALDDLVAALVDTIGRDYAGVHLSALPLGVLLENVAGLYVNLLAGGTCRLPAQASIGLAQPFRPDFPALVEALAESAATSTILVPELLKGIVRALAQTGLRLPLLRFVAVGGATVSQSLLAAAEEVGLPVYQGYGLSEAGSVLALNTPGANRPGSVGRPLPHASLTLNGKGEVSFGPPAFLGHAGQANPPRETFATGDLGFIDADGFLHIRGRKANTVITGFGRNVAPEWVEGALLAAPEIAQAMVFGDGAPALGALIVPSGPAIAAEDIDRAVAAANATLPEYAHVRHWTLTRPFTPGAGEASPNGRLRRKAIAEARGALMRDTLGTAGRYEPFFRRLVGETRSEQAYLLETRQIRDGLAGHISRETYLHYLAEAYHHVRHTVPLLRLVKQRLPEGRQWLVPALDEYIAEESGHEEWILDDIANAGGDAGAVRRSEPRAATEFMVAYAYDTVMRRNPVGFFGMVYVLEGTSTQLATAGAEALMRSLQLAPDCFHYLLSHGSLDIGHMAFFEGLMNRIERPDDQAAIIHMARRMYVLFANMFRAIPHRSPDRDAA